MIATQVVYVIGSADCPVKIGIATSLKGRLKQLQTGNPEELRCHHFVRVPVDRAIAVEAAAHRHFKDRHRRGEWFDVDWREAAELLEQLALIENACAYKGDILDTLRNEYGMSADGPAAVADYLGRMARGDKYVGYANGHILKKVGSAGYAAFSLVVAQRKSLYGLNQLEHMAAMCGLTRSINELCKFRRKYARLTAEAAERRRIESLRAA